MSVKASWDIFCAVVDNFGDIGVTWRLARQLVAEHDQCVRLWVDDLETFVRLCPTASASAAQQWHEQVEIRHWTKDWQAAEPADVVIEAFACELPPAYIAAMADSGRRILWLNLEYLSAEDWVVGCHALPSMQPDGLHKYFFFPGFEQGTGGLLREGDLLDRRDAFRNDPQHREALLGSFGIELQPGAQLISLFAYENAAIPGWLDVLAAGPKTTQLLIPEGRVLGDVARWLGVSELGAGAQHQRGSLRIAVLPFMTQNQYDQLLWCCDFNAIRGEESFIRAQWAGRPLVWHIYPQEEDAHWDKLDAFFELYSGDLAPASTDALRAFWRAWNDGVGSGEAWCVMQHHLPALQLHAERWTHKQVANGDLAGKLVFFYTDWLGSVPVSYAAAP
ncbi:hypothetical protein BBI09_09790 [Stutzerimonas xanthomarina]|uniref:elongation factor P maturation arginine rhamnosyltransferase EarP n=1 Tax=Stutzerimonas nitrititolerans TaxID=2482751 RepID=UPI000826A8FF|nr:elongation factor P maturation arginine rhamnosyltransferase EarP [Stutzerimonas nitrititolerans]OCX19315.1 hypothetical protein BBI09_09790 [Stutzerimonas xanthomarina]HBB78291.1 elongation factor P maturation arginine rhamnosyltransferase EarP [Pseudomonas sp.]